MILALLLLAMAGDSPFRSTEDVQRWLTYYYLRPRPDPPGLARVFVAERESHDTVLTRVAADPPPRAAAGG